MAVAIEMTGEQGWFCVRSQPKREHIAAANVKPFPGVEVFNPRLRYRKITRRGPVWFVESLFPNYLFVRFSAPMLEEIKFAPGVSYIVHFGDRYPTVPETVMQELKDNFGLKESQLFLEVPREGEEVTITDKALYGMQAVVLKVLPAKERVQVLLEMLGRTSTVELKLSSVVAERRSLGRELVAITV